MIKALTWVKNITSKHAYFCIFAIQENVENYISRTKFARIKDFQNDIKQYLVVNFEDLEKDVTMLESYLHFY